MMQTRPRVAALLAAALLHAVVAPAQPAGDDWISAGGYGNFYIKTTDDMAAELRANADFFRDLWRKTTSLEIETGPVNRYGFITVALSFEGLTRDVLDPAQVEGLGSEGYYLYTYTPSERHTRFGATRYLVVSGNTPQSTRVGIYGFFRRAFGTEWLAPGVVDLRRAGFKFEKRKEALAPAFAFREVGFLALNTPEEAEFRVANGLPATPVPAHFGRDSSYSLLPPEKHFDAHPEYYAEVEGKRVALKDAWRKPEEAKARMAELGDICPTAPGIAEAITAAIQEAVAAPEKSGDLLVHQRRVRAGWLSSRKIWALTPMRGGRPCKCAACVALVESEKSPMAPWLALANETATRLEAAYPGEGYRVLTHAFGPGLKPPATMKAADNVIVVLFTDACDFSTPLEAKRSPENAAFADALDAWDAAAEQIWISDSLGSLRPEPTPFPSLGVLQDNLRLYAQRDVSGVYFQARGPFPRDDDFSALKYFVAARLLWDPDADVEQLTTRFLDGYYGPLGAAVRQYLSSLAPQPGLTPLATAQPGLLEQRAAGQAALGAAAEQADAAVKSRVEALLPAPR